MEKWKRKTALCLLAAFFVFGFKPYPANAAQDDNATTVSSWEELVSAVKNADAGDTIKIDNDIDATTSASLRVSENITVDGQGHTLDGQDRYGFFVTKGGTLTLKNTVLANAKRESSKKACAIYAYSGGGANLENCLLYNCADNYSGYGAIYCSSYPLNMTNCTVLSNANGVTIGTTGGKLSGNIIAGNKGTDVIFKSTSSKAVDGGYNLIGTTTNQPQNFASATTTIDKNLSDFSKWMNEEGDLLKSEESPAIDKIPADTAWLGAKDIYGTARPQGEKADIGAVEYEPESKTVTEIKVTKEPSKTEYIEGQSFNKSGMEVTAYYEDGTSRVIRTYTCDVASKLTTDDKEVTISYAGKTCTQKISVSSRSLIDSAEKLKEAIVSASAGDTITLSDDITLDSSWAGTGTPLTVSKNITIDGNGYKIDGNGKYAFMDANTNVSLKIYNTVIQDMYAEDDAAVVNVASKKNANIEMKNCIVKENEGYHGTIYLRSGTLLIDHCTFMDNHQSGSSSNYGNIYSYTSGAATIQNSILVNNTGTTKSGTVNNDIYAKSVIGDHNVIGTEYSTTWKTGNNNKVDGKYNNYRLWMSDSGKLYYPPLSPYGNPAVDINAEEKPEGVLSTDINGKSRSQGKGSDAGAVESTERNAATPNIVENLTADTDTYSIGDKAKELKIKANVNDDGTLSYDWYYIDYIDAVTTATVQIEGEHKSSYTPPTSSVGTRGYFAIAYNTNEQDPYINGKNGVIDKTNDDTKRATAVYAISETHQVDVSAGDSKITGLTIKKAPDKVTYVEGQEFDRTGMEVMVHYNNGAVYPVTGYTSSPTTALTTDDKEIEISYEGFTVKQPVKVVKKAVTSLEITKAPVKTDYVEGESFDKTGMVVTATYNDGTKAEITDYEVSFGTNMTKDTKEVTISCIGENGKTIKAGQAVNVGINDITQLRKAVTNAKSGDTLLITSDIVMNDDKGSLEINKDLTINGQGHKISGNKTNAFATVKSGNITLKNLKIADMYSEDGGAVIDCNKTRSDLTIENCVITNNKGALGAVYYAPSQGTLKINFCTIIGNQSATAVQTAARTRSVAADGVAGGVNAGSKADVELSNNVLVGNSFYRASNIFDINLDKKQASKGHNLVSAAQNLNADDSDKIDAAYADYKSWMMEDGTPIKVDNSPIILVERDENIKTDQAGKLRNDQTAVGALELQEKQKPSQPVISKNLVKNIKTKEDNSISLMVKATANGELSYQWYKDNKKIKNANESVLEIKKAKVLDSGKYYVEITNTLSGETKTIKSAVCEIVVEKKAAATTATDKKNQPTTAVKKPQSVKKPATATKPFILVKVKASTKTTQTLTWNKVKGAAGYKIYRAKSNGKVKCVKTVKKTVTTWKSTKLKKAAAYKYYVVAYKKSGKKNITIAKSSTVYAVTKGGKYGNPTKITVVKKTYTLKRGKTAVIKAKVSTGKQKVKNYAAKVRYESSNKNIVKVNNKGKITAVSKGTAYVYCYTQNGISQKVKVTVK